MITVKPFRGLRPVQNKVKDIASPPYDVLSSREAREKANGNPLSFLHVIKPEIDFEPDIDPFDPMVYSKGAENLKKLIDQGVLVQDKKSCYYIYKLTMEGREQIGLVAAASVEDYNEDRIKKHEFTRPDKENDRVRHVDNLNAQSGPVFLTYRAQKEIDDLLQKGMENKPVYDFIGDYQVQHTFYVVDNDNLIQKILEAFRKLDTLYVADGHHRSAAASRVHELRKAKNPNHTGEEEYNYFLTVIFPDSQMLIMDYNRVVRDLNGLSTDTFLDMVAEKFDVLEPEVCCGCTGCEERAFRPQKMHQFGMYLKGKWHCLTAKEGSFNASDPIAVLDVAILQNNLLTPILGIQDPRTDKRIDFVGGIRGLAELEHLVNSREYEVAFSMYPTSIQQLMAVADAGKVMPPKSTWFEPKLRSGVVVHMLDERGK
jgi:uncharacterized protein (DUF1015 family)